MCMLVVGKEASTLSTLHGIANCVKNETTRKIVSSNQCQHLAGCSVARNYFRSGLRILFKVFLGTKTKLWKLMWVISWCCSGSSGSPLHPPLLRHPQNSFWSQNELHWSAYSNSASFWTNMKILKNVQPRLHIENGIRQILHCYTFYFLNCAQCRYVKCLFANT